MNEIQIADKWMEENKTDEPTTVVENSNQITIILEKENIIFNYMGEEGTVVGNDIRALRHVIQSLSDVTDTKCYKIIDKR